MIKTHIGPIGKEPLPMQPGRFVRGRRVDRGAITKGANPTSTPDNKRFYELPYGHNR